MKWSDTRSNHNAHHPRPWLREEAVLWMTPASPSSPRSNLLRRIHWKGRNHSELKGFTAKVGKLEVPADEYSEAGIGFGSILKLMVSVGIGIDKVARLKELWELGRGMSKQMIEILCLSGQGHVEHCSIEMSESVSTVRSYSQGDNDHTFVRWAHCPLLSMYN